MNESLQKLTEALGEALRRESTVAEYAAAKKAYSEDSATVSCVSEYNVQKMLLENEQIQKGGDKALAESVNARIRALYDRISSAESMKRLTKAENELNTLLNEVNAKLMSYVLPESDCTGNCQSCSGCH